MKKLLFFFYALAFAFIFSSCEELDELVGNKVEIESPYTDLIISNVECKGWFDGEVWLNFDAVVAVDCEIWFGSPTATIGTKSYRMDGNIAFVNFYEGDKKNINFYGQDGFSDGICAFQGVSTASSSFDLIEVPIKVTGSDDIEYIKFKNVPIDWQ